MCYVEYVMAEDNNSTLHTQNNLYRVVSRGFRVSYIIARSNLHAVQIAVSFGTHVSGKRVNVFRVSTKSLKGELLTLMFRAPSPGRVLMPNIFRRDYILLIHEDD